MKKNFTSLLLLLSTFMFAQMATYDAAAQANMMQQIAQTTKQLEQAERSYAILEKAKDKVDKVSSAIKQVNEIKSFIEMQSEILNNVATVLQSKRKYITDKQLQRIIKSTGKSIVNIKNLLSDDFFSLNDKERMDLIKEEKVELLNNLVRSRMYKNSVE